jgi:hypothetical protein
MEKISFAELCERMYNFNEEKKSRNDYLRAVVVFTEDSFTKEYTLKERSYAVTSDNKLFKEGMSTNSLYGDCLDGKDPGVRLDRYIKAATNPWKVDYCYFLD